MIRAVRENAGLRYVSDTKPGLSESALGRGFRYVDGDGESHNIGSTDVNESLREMSTEEFHGEGFSDVGGYDAGQRDATGV